ncbi:MAG: hypothetical protein R3283_07580, partial [Balneolaceae bacterium]|nr:hypothetical protein [Balneolaceae bacterium]
MISTLLIILLAMAVQAGADPGSLAVQDTTFLSGEQDFPVILEQDLSDSLFFSFQELETERVTNEQLTDEDHIVYLRDQWRFQPGDNTAWSDIDYDDSGWEIISTNLTSADLSFVEWNGVGWFRKKVIVDPELAGKPIALIVDRHLGASEIYLNGEKILELGRFSTDPEQVENYSSGQPPVI